MLCGGGGGLGRPRRGDAVARSATAGQDKAEQCTGQDGNLGRVRAEAVPGHHGKRSGHPVRPADANDTPGLIRARISDFRDWGDPERIVVNAATVYRELDPGSEPVGPPELFARMGRWISRHGG